VPQTAVKGTKLYSTRLAVAKAELGIKRIDPETGRKFYDLNKDPIVSPYTGKSYPRSYFDDSKASAIEDEEDEVEEKEVDAEEDGPEVVSLEDADEQTKKGGGDAPDVDADDDDVELDDDDDDDTFLADDEEDDDDVSDLIGVGDDDDES
jgi:uncharacterized protein (TIGR02300 family)